MLRPTSRSSSANSLRSGNKAAATANTESDGPNLGGWAGWEQEHDRPPAAPAASATPKTDDADDWGKW